MIKKRYVSDNLRSPSRFAPNRDIKWNFPGKKTVIPLLKISTKMPEDAKNLEREVL